MQGIRTYHKWHNSALQKINHEYHVIQNGILNKKDYSLIFENEKEKCDIPVEIVDQINIYSDVTIAPSGLKLISEKNIRLSIIDKYGNLMGNYIPEGYSRAGKDFLQQVSFYRKCSIISTLTNVRPLTWPAVLVSPVCEFCLAASVTMEADLPEMTGRFDPNIWVAQ